MSYSCHQYNEHTNLLFYRIAFSWRHNQQRKKSARHNIYVEHTSMSTMNVGDKLDGEADKENIQEHEMCDVDNEKKKEQED